MPPSTGRPSSAQRIDKHKLLSAHPFFRNFTSAIVDRLVSHAVTRRVKKGTVLFRKGDTGTNLYAVCAGSVRISVPSEQGQDAIFNLFQTIQMGLIHKLKRFGRCVVHIIKNGDSGWFQFFLLLVFLL